MKAIFPYLTLENLKKLFSRRRMALKKNGADSDELSTPPSVVTGLRFAGSKVLESYGSLAARCVDAPAAFLCTPAGDILWQTARLPLSLERVENDILKHLRESSSPDIAVVSVADPAPPTGEMGMVRCCAMVPVRTEKGDRLGALVLIFEGERSMSEAEKERLRFIAAQLSEKAEKEEVLRQCAMSHNAVQVFSDFMLNANDDDWPAALAHRMADLANIDYALIAERIGPGDGPFRTLAVSFQRGLLKNFDLEFSHSPFDHAHGRHFCLYASDVPRLFPENASLKELGIESLSGVLIPDHSGHARLMVLLMDRKPFSRPLVIESLLKAASGPITARLERDHAIGRLEELRHRHNDLVEGAMEAFYEISPEDRLVGANAALARMLGYASPAEMMRALGTFSREVFADPEGRRQFLERVKASRDPVESRWQILRRTGSKLWISERIHPRRDPEGVLLGYEAAAEDISARVAAEQALRAAELRFNSLFSKAPFAAALADAGGLILKTNPAFEQLLGFPESDLKFKKWTELAAGEGDRLRPFARNGGGRLLARVTIIPCPDEDGTPAAQFIVLEDCTTLENAQNDFHVADLLLRTIFESAGSGIAVLDPQGRITRNNTAMERLFGKSSKQLHSMPVPELFDPDGRRELESLLADCASGKRDRFQIEVRVPSKGPEVWHRFSCAAARNGEGRCEYLTALIDNVTALKRATDILERGESPVERMLDHAGIGLAVMDSRGCFTRVSAPLAALLGYDSEDLLRRCFTDLGHPDDSAEWVEMKRELTEGSRDHCRFEKRLVRKDRSMIWASVVIFAIRLSDKSLHGLVGMIENITESRQSVEKSLALSGRLASLYRAPGYAFTLLDPKGALVETSAMFQELLGYSGEELRDKALTDLAHPGDRQRLESLELECARGDRDRFEAEGRLLKKNGAEVWVRLAVAGVNGAGSAPRPMMGIIEDLSGLRRTEEKLRAVEEQLQVSEVELIADQALYRALFEGSGCGIAVTNESGEIVETNPALQELLGYPASELESKTIADLSHPEDPGEDAPMQQQCLDGTLHHYRVDKRLLAKSGDTVCVRLSAAVLSRSDGSLECTFFTFDDQTALKRAEAEMVSEQDRAEEDKRDSERILRISQLDLEASEARFRELFERAGIGIAILDSSGRFTQANPSLLRMLRWEAGELKAKTFAELGHPEDGTDDAPFHRECVEGKRERYQVEKRFLRGDGGYFWGRLIVSRVADGEGAFKSAVATLEDIRDYKQPNRPRAETMSLRFRSPEEGFIATDQSGRVMLMNHAAEKILGAELADVFSKPFEEVFNAVEHNNRHRLQNLPVDDNKPPEDSLILIESRLKCAGGEKTVLQSSRPLLDLEANIMGTITVMRDAEEVEKMEKYLIETGKLESEAVMDAQIANEYENILTNLCILAGPVMGDLNAEIAKKEDAGKAAARATELTRELSKSLATLTGMSQKSLD